MCHTFLHFSLPSEVHDGFQICGTPVPYHRKKLFGCYSFLRTHAHQIYLLLLTNKVNVIIMCFSYMDQIEYNVKYAFKVVAHTYGISANPIIIGCTLLKCRFHHFHVRQEFRNDFSFRKVVTKPATYINNIRKRASIIVPRNYSVDWMSNNVDIYWVGCIKISGIQEVHMLFIAKRLLQLVISWKMSIKIKIMQEKEFCNSSETIMRL